MSRRNFHSLMQRYSAACLVRTKRRRGTGEAFMSGSLSGEVAAAVRRMKGRLS